MTPPIAAGDLVQTPFGKGTVRELRNNDRVVVEVRGRAMVLARSQISPVDARARRAPSSARGRRHAPAEAPTRAHRHTAASAIDVHGLTVEQALGRIDEALNDALLADLPELRVIHGRSGGRIRAALHRHLRGIRSVRSFRLDPQNDGVTIVSL